MLGIIISAIIVACYVWWCSYLLAEKTEARSFKENSSVLAKLTLITFCAVIAIVISLDLFYFSPAAEKGTQKIATRSTNFLFDNEENEEGSAAPQPPEPASLDFTILKPANIRTRFTDVAGLDEAKAEIIEVVDFLKNPDKYEAIGAEIPKGILLYGPPGTGKTLLARAVAGESNVTFIAVDGAAFDEMYVGVGAARVRELFEIARKNQPCIVFIDEIDALAPSRGETGAVMSGRIQTVNQLLSEMDNIQEDKNSGVIMMAATNRLESLDTALLRPGRFDRSIFIRLPNFNERVALFKVHLKQVPHTNIELESLAGSTYGFSGADIKNLVNEAALHAVKGNKKLVDKTDFFYAMDKIKLGLEVKSAIVSDEEKLLTAYHEAGHTIVGIFSPNYKHEFNKVTIGVRDETLGVTHFESIGDNYGYSKAFIQDNIAMLLGGRIAEEMLVGKEHITTGASNDLKIATELAERMVVDWGFSDLGNNISFAVLENYSSDLVHQEIKKILDTAQTKARNILESKRDKLEELAKALVKKEILDRTEVLKILEIDR